MVSRKVNLLRHAIPLSILVAAAFAVFGLSMGHDLLINWDDPSYVTNNEVIRCINWINIRKAFTTFYVSNYAPLHIISYMADYALWGGKPSGFVFGNILCHVASGALFYAILIRFSLSRMAALFAALFFLLHPVQVESVVWISQRKNVLAMFFYLLAFLMYLRWFHSSPGKRNITAYFVSLTAFVVALLVKSVAVILPLILIIHDFCNSVDRRPGKIITDKLPYLMTALGVGCLAMLTQLSEYGGGGRTGYHGGSPLATLFTMLPVFISYLRMVVWPSGLSVAYSPEIKTAIDGEVAAAALLIVAMIVGAFWIYRRKRSLFFWVAAIPAGLLPVSQIVPLVTLMNDRYLYFPMIGIAACCGYIFEWVTAKASRERLILVVTLCSLQLAVYGVLSLHRAQVWQNSLLLWQDGTVKQPASAVAWYMLGGVYELGGKSAAAIDAEERAKGLCKGVECRLVMRKLSELYLRENLLDKARNNINELLLAFPDDAVGHALSGHLSYQQGGMVKAEESYLKALHTDPLMVEAIVALGNIYLATGRPGLAMNKFMAATQMQKPSAELAYSKACAAALLGNRRLALDLLDEAIRLGYNKLDLLTQNPELASLKGELEFRMLLDRYFPGR